MVTTKEPTRTKAVLIVEDDVDIRETLQAVLEDEGYTVSAACNGREGLDKLAEMHEPGLVLLDLMMPVMSGPEFLEVKRADPNLAKIPVLIVSAFGEVTGVPGGAVGFIRKPVDLDLLLQHVRDFCDVG